MSNDPVALLVGEHEIISSANEVIDGMDQLWLESIEVYEECLRGIISLLAEYGDAFHHGKEESALFPALRNHPNFYLHGLLDELEDHHRMFRDHLARIRQSLDEKNYGVAQSTLRHYFDELLDHIAVENDELFVMAGSLFNHADLEALYFRFKDVDRERGEELKHELEASVARLRAAVAASTGKS